MSAPLNRKPIIVRGLSKARFEKTTDPLGEEMIHSGWIMKQGGNVKSWKKRFLVLTSNGWLYYYKTEKDLKPQGTIPINTIISVDIETDPQIYKAPSANLFRLNVTGTRKFYLFSTEVPKEKDEWVSKIRDQLALFNGKRDSVATHLGMSDDNKFRPYMPIDGNSQSNLFNELEPSSPRRSPLVKKRSEIGIKLDSSSQLNVDREMSIVQQHSQDLPQSTNEDLLQAITKNDLLRVKTLLTAGSDTKCRFTDTSGTALHLAVETAHIDIAKLLLETHPKLLNLTDSLGRTALNVAIIMNKLDFVLLLLEYHPLLCICDKQGKSGVYLGIFLGKAEIATALLAKAAEYIANEKSTACLVEMSHVDAYFGEEVGDVNCVSKDMGMRPLHLAAANPKAIATVASLLSKGVAIDASDAGKKTALHYAAASGNSEALALLIEHKSNVNYVDMYNKTPLHFAAGNARFKCCQLLIKAGANIECKDESGFTPLHHASLYGHLDIVQLFIKSGANVNCKSNDGTNLKENALIEGVTPLLLACFVAHFDVISLLLKHGADPNLSESPLITFIKRNQIEFVQLLLENGADPNAKDDGVDCLLLATRNGSEQIASLLLQHGAKANTRDAQGRTPLHFAAELGLVHLTPILIQHGAKLESRFSGRTPLHVAVEHSFSVVKHLLDAGASVNAEDHFKFTPLLTAVSMNNIELVKLLLNKGSNPNHKALQWSPLTLASSNGNSACLSLLLENGADSNLKDGEGSFAIHEAAANGRAECLKILIASGAKIDIVDDGGLTALHRAAPFGETECIRILIQHKADVICSRPDLNRCSSLSNGHLEAAKVIIEAGASVNQPNVDNVYPLHVAASLGDLNCIVSLIKERNAVPQCRDIHLTTPLHIASQNGNLEVVNFLISNGALVNTPDEVGQTALHKACARLDTDTAEALIKAGATVNVVDRALGITPIGYAVRSQNSKKYALLELLLKSKADINIPEFVMGRTLLHEAAGDRESTLLLLKNGALVNVIDKDGVSALLLNAKLDSLPCIQLLLEHGADIDLIDVHHKSPLYESIRRGSYDVTRFLLEKGAKVNWKSFHAGCLTKDVNIISMLLNAGDGVNLTDEKLINPLFLVVDSIECFKLLERSGADVNAVSSDGDTVWHFAARNGAENTISHLLSQNIGNVSRKNMQGMSPIMEAVSNGYLSIVKLLLPHSDVGEVDNNGYNLLHLSCQSRNIELFQLLLDSNVPIATSTDGSTLLHTSAKYGSLEICRKILENKMFPIDVKGPNGGTCLHSICGSEQSFEIQVLQFLLNYGANFKTKDNSGKTPIFEAARTGNRECLELLINIDSDLSTKDSEDNTPLHVLVARGHEDCANLLINRGADVNLANKLGLQPLHEAARNGFLVLSDLLLQHGAKVNARTNRHKTPLHYAAKHGQATVLVFLLDNGAEVNAITDKQVTALHLSAQYGHSECVSVLLHRNAYVNARDCQFSTALHKAAESGHSLCLQLLVDKGADIAARDLQNKIPIEYAKGECENLLLKAKR